jgi:hypothetical protein
VNHLEAKAIQDA